MGLFTAVAGVATDFITKGQIEKARAAAEGETLGGIAKADELFQEGFGTTEGELSPFVSTGTNALELLAGSLGLNGTVGRDTARQAFQSSPGFQFALNQGQQLIENSNATKGLLSSGATARDLTKFGQGLANQEFNSFLDRLGGLSGGGQSAAVDTGRFRESAFGNRASLEQQAANTRASGILAKSQAKADKIKGIGSAVGGIADLATGYSSRAFKEDDAPPETILDGVKELPVRAWRYKPEMGQGTRRHIGPYAEDWQETFGLGDGVTIDMVDGIGVCLQAIKELAEEVDALRPNA